MQRDVGGQLDHRVSFREAPLDPRLDVVDFTRQARVDVRTLFSEEAQLAIGVGFDDIEMASEVVELRTRRCHVRVHLRFDSFGAPQNLAEQPVKLFIRHYVAILRLDPQYNPPP